MPQLAERASCPQPDLLAQLLIGQLSQSQAEPLEQHLLQCSACATAAQTLSTHDTLIEAMRTYQPLVAEDESAVKRLAGRVQQSLPTGTSAEVIDLSSADGSEPNLFARLARVLHDPAEPPPPARDVPACVAESDLYDFLAPAQAADELGRLGAYRVLKVLGAGGMGVVFLAEDVELKRRVALKAMHPALAASTGARERFQREAQAMAAIDHEHIVTIFHVGRDRGVPYLVMSLLDGETLDEQLLGRKLATPEVLRIGREVAQGLDAAHRRGLIHRDIKPANIFLERDTGRVKLLDFGLARAVDADVKLTHPGAIVGTPAFMSPEQARGEPTDARSDLFSLGCVLYLMSTGVPPFLGRDATAVVTAVVNEAPEPPAAIRPELPVALSGLIVRLLSKSRDARPVSAAAVADELTAIDVSRRADLPLARQITNLPHENERSVSKAPLPADLPIVPAPVVESIVVTATNPAPSKRRRSLLATAVCVFALAAGSWYGPAIYRFTTNQGLLVIETDDPSIEVKVTQGGKQINVIDLQTGNSISLESGNYNVALANDRNDVKLERDTVTLTRGGKQVVKIVRQENVAAAKPVPPSVEPEPIVGKKPPLTIAQDDRVGYVRRLLGHTEMVSRVAFSPDGQRAVTGSWDRTARLWDVATGKEIRRFAGHTGGVQAAAVTPDGRFVLTGESDWFDKGERKAGHDFALRLFDLESGELVRRFEGHRKEVIDLCISADGRWAVSCGLDWTVRQWDLETGQEQRRCECHTAVWAVALSRDNRRVVAGCPDGVILLLDMEQEREIKRFTGHTAPITSVAFSPDESHFVSSSDDGQPRIWNVQDGSAQLLPKHPAVCVSAAYTPDGKFVLTTCWDKVVRMWEAKTGKLVHRFEGHTAAASKVAVSPDGRFALSGSSDSTVRLWGLPRSPQLQPPAQFGPMPLDEWLKGRKIVTVSQDGKADHKTIEAALKAMQKGQVVEVLDRGPYVETFELTVPEDVGLISRVGTRIELKHWRPFSGVQDPQKHRYWGWTLFAPRGLRLSGVEFACAKLPADTEDATAIGLRAAGNVIVDRCRILHNPRYGIVRSDNVDPELFTFFGLSVEPFQENSPEPTRVHYDQNLIEGTLFTRLDYPAPITIERCVLLGWRWATLKLLGDAGPVVVRHNVIHGNGGPEFHGRQPHTSLLFANNLVNTDHSSLLFWSGEKPAQRPLLQRNVRIENNILRSFHTEGINLMADEPGNLAADWRVGNNCYTAAPVAVRELAPFPVQSSDCVHAMPFASIDTSDPNYLLPVADGPLASSGAGGDLPDYIGPLAPQPDAVENAWFAELDREWRQEFGPRLKPYDITAPPPLEEWLKGRKIRTVAQDGSAEFKTLVEARASLQPGQVIEVQDRGPYHETFDLDWPADTGLVSRVGTHIEFTKWNGTPAGTAGKQHYSGLYFGVTDGLRLSGLRVSGPRLPDDAEFAWAIVIGRSRGAVTVENCVVLHNPPYELTPPQDVGVQLFVGISFNKNYVPRSAPLAMCVRDSWIGGRLSFDGECRGNVLVERNCITSWGNDGLVLPSQAQDVVIRHNVISAMFGVYLMDRSGHPTGARLESRYLIANNVFQVLEFPLSVYAAFAGPLNALAPPAKNVRFENNVLWSRSGLGVSANSLDLSVAERTWHVGHNVYAAEPKPWGDGRAFPRQDTDRIAPKPFLSDDQAAADFLHIAANSPLASGGAGGDLPKYIGAFPPGPAPDDDWFFKLRAKAKQPAATTPSTSIAPEVKPGFVRRFYGHTEYIRYVAFSRDGQQALSSSCDKTARLWNVATGEEVKRYAHTGGVTAMALSNDGRYALTGQGDSIDKGTERKAEDFDLRLWKTDSGELVRRFEGHRGDVIMVCLSDDGRWAVSGGIDKTVRQWDVETGKEKRRFDCHSPVFGLALSRDNRRVLVGCQDGTALLLDIQAEREIKRFTGHAGRVPYVAFSPDESQFVSASDDGEPRIWNLQSGQSLKLPKHPGGTFGAVFTPDGKSVLTTCNDGVVRLWDAGTGKLVQRFEGHTDGAKGLAVSPDGRFALSASADTTLRLWSLPTGPTLQPPKQFGPTPLDEWLKGRKIITVSQDGKGDHKTIEAALKALKQGEVVEVLDRGPYREMFEVDLPEDVGLISRAGTRIELREWRKLATTESGKGRYWGWILRAPRGLRLSGLEFVGAKTPADANDENAVCLRAAGDVIVDNCRVLHNPRYSLAPPDHDDPDLVDAFGLVLETYVPDPHRPCRVHYDRNLIEGRVFFNVEYPTPITIERCLLLGWRWQPVYMTGNVGSVVLRHNVIHSSFAAFLNIHKPHASFLVVNNLFDCRYDPLGFWQDPKQTKLEMLPRQVRIENNIVRSRGNEGFNVLPAELASILADWRVGNNCYATSPVAAREMTPFPLQPSDRIDPVPFASIDAADPAYLLLKADNSLATGGAGGDLPTYIGPLAPQANAPENAWCVDLHRDWQRAIGPRLKGDEVPPPSPLTEWLEGRTIRTVSQDGSGDFKTIAEAIAALKPGEVVKVLDKGPYVESLDLTLPADTGLVSEIGTHIQFAKWQTLGAATKGKSNYFGARLIVGDGFRLSGLRFAGPKPPDDTEGTWAIALERVRGNVTIEDCVVRHDHPRYTFTPRGPDVYPYFFRGLSFNKNFTPRDAATSVCLRDNWIDGMVTFDGECRATILVERNCILGWRNDALYLPRQAQDVVVRHNVLAGWYGLGIAERQGHPVGVRPESRYTIVNNVLMSASHPIAGLWLAPGPINDLASLPKNVHIANNLIWSRESCGIVLSPYDLAAVQTSWQVDHNAYVASPGAWQESPAFPLQPGDRVEPKPFLSDDQASADFLRTKVDGPLATGGAGGDLPNYIGAFPPGPAPETGDWFTRLLQRASGD